MNSRDREVFSILVCMIIGGSVGLVILHLCQTFAGS